MIKLMEDNSWRNLAGSSGPTAVHLSQNEDTPMTPMRALRSSLGYLHAGLAITQENPWIFAQILVYFSLPSFLASLLAGLIPQDGALVIPVLFSLDSITALVGPVAFMMAVGGVYRGDVITLSQVVRRALPWLPRYVWTNVHTSVVFWAPVASFLVLGYWSGMQLSSDTTGELLLSAAWWLALGSLSAYFHSRTLLAPFLAVHSNVPGTQAAWESWRLSGTHPSLYISTFLVGSTPLGLPFLLVAVLLLSGYDQPFGLRQVLPHFLGIGIQLGRLTLIPAAYVLYRDIWSAETTLREREGTPSAPAFVHLLHSMTAWLPPLGPMGNREAEEDRLPTPSQRPA